MIVELTGFDRIYLPLIKEVISDLKNSDIELYDETKSVLLDVANEYQLFLLGLSCGHLMAQKSYNEIIDKGSEALSNSLKPSTN